MSRSSFDETSYPSSDNAIATPVNKYKGIRRRKWGKWVSEIRVPGTPHRLWLGSYATPEAAAVAHDVACYCLRGDSSPEKLNFPLILPSTARVGLSPLSVQRAASNAGLAMDARLLDSNTSEADKTTLNYMVEEENACLHNESSNCLSTNNDQENLSISVEDYLELYMQM